MTNKMNPLNALILYHLSGGHEGYVSEEALVEYERLTGIDTTPDKEESNIKDWNNWIPTTDTTELKVLGKFLEELGECSNATARVLIHGIGEFQPGTEESNSKWLQDEISDVLATAALVVEYYSLNETELEQRITKKYNYLKEWMYSGNLD